MRIAEEILPVIGELNGSDESDVPRNLARAEGRSAKDVARVVIHLAGVQRISSEDPTEVDLAECADTADSERDLVQVHLTGRRFDASTHWSHPPHGEVDLAGLPLVLLRIDPLVEILLSSRPEVIVHAQGLTLGLLGLHHGLLQLTEREVPTVIDVHALVDTDVGLPN